MAIEEELELDISSALSGVDRVGDALDQSAKQFKVSLADALNTLRGVEVEADATQVTSTIDQAIAQADNDIDIEGEAAEVTSSIDEAVGAADNEIDVDADTSAAEAEIESLAPPPIEIEVDADTSNAQAEIDGLASSSDSASGSVGGLDSATGAMGATAGVASGSVEELAGAVAGLDPRAAAAVGGVLAVAGATGILFNSAVGAQGATQSFNQTLGSMGQELRDLEIGDVNIDLTQLAQNLGSDDEAALRATQRLGQVGKAAGATDDEIKAVSDRVLLLAANTRATNPDLGEMGQVVTALTRGLTRGGPRMAQYGVSMDSLEVRARAAQMTGRDLNDTFDVWTLLQAGSQIAMEQTGDSIESNITNASDNAEISLTRLQQVFGDSLEELGKPLLIPVFDLLEAAIPIGLQISEVFGEIGQALVPIATGALEAVAPLLDLFSDTLIQQVRIFTPVLERATELLGDILPPIADALEPVMMELADVTELLAEETIDLIEAYGPLLPLLAQATGLFLEQFAGAAELLKIWTDLSGAIPGVGSGFAGLDGDVGKFVDTWGQLPGATTLVHDTFGWLNDSQIELRESMYGTTFAIDDVVAKQLDLNDVLLKYVQRKGALANDLGVRRSFQDMGYDAASLADDFQDLDEGFGRFAARGSEMGEIKIEIDGVEQTTEQIEALGGGLAGYLREGRAVMTQGAPLSQAWMAQQHSIEAVARSQFENIAASEGWSDSQIESLMTLGQVEFGVRSYQNALQALGFEQQRIAERTQAAIVLPAEQQKQAWISIADAVRAGDVTTQNYGTTLEGMPEKLGVTAEQMGTFVETINAQVVAVADTITANIPNATAAFDGLEESTDPAQLAANLEAQRLAVEEFQHNLGTLLDQGFDDVVALLAQRGPEAGGGLAKAVVEGGPELAGALEGQIEQFDTSTDNLENFLRNTAAPAIAGADGAIVDMAQQGVSALGSNLDLSSAAEQPVEDLGVFLVNDPRPGWAGEDVGRDLTSGMVKGIDETTWRVRDAAAEAIRQAEQAARDEAESKSPSKLFERVGKDLTAGVALGVTADQAQVDAAFQGIIRSMASDLAAGVTTLSTGGNTTVNNITHQAAPLVGSMTVRGESPQETGAQVVKRLRQQSFLGGN